MLAEMLTGFREIFAAPFKDLSVWWLLAPLISIWIVLEVYFAIRKEEEFGWNSAIASGASLFWILMALLKHVFSQDLNWLKISVLFLILAYALILIYIAFGHKLPAKATYLLAGPTITYF